MPSRTYEVEAEPILPEDFWPGATIEAPAGDQNALADLMMKASAVLEMVGGVFTVMAVRKEIAPDLFVPDRYVAKWESFAPAQRQPRPAPAPQEPVAASQAPPEAQTYPEAESELSEPQGGPEAAVEDWPEDAERALEKV